MGKLPNPPFESQPKLPVGLLQVVEPAGEDNAAVANHRHLIGNALDLIEQVRRNEDTVKW
jgi:hypothetical protein